MKFTLSSRELVKLSFMILLATVFFGLGGLIVMLIMQWMTIQTYAEDSIDKHGISEVKASRLGGIALAMAISGAIFVLVSMKNLNVLDELQIRSTWPLWLAGFGCFLIGLIEDLWNNSLPPRIRLILMALIVLSVFIWAPDLVPKSLGFWPIDIVLNQSFFGLVLFLIFSVGFVNAMNVVDGANGLVSGVFVIMCYIFAQELDALALSASLYGACLFFVFNIVSGRLFLGDAGAYGIGVAILFISLIAYKNEICSVFFLAALLFYPCFDFLVSIIRRYRKGAFMTEADNEHLHNRINNFYKTKVKSKNLANSLTGLSIVLGTSGIVFIFYLFEIIPLESSHWSLIFIFETVLYMTIYFFLNNEKFDEYSST